MQNRIYIAGPLFNTHERWYLEQIAKLLEEAGYDTFLPHRDAGLLDGTENIDRVKLFQGDLNGLNQCNIVVALLTGADQDSGTSAELGIAYERGLPCFGITDDMRFLNNMIWGICGEGKHLAKTIDALLPLIENRLSDPIPQQSED